MYVQIKGANRGTGHRSLHSGFGHEDSGQINISAGIHLQVVNYSFLLFWYQVIIFYLIYNIYKTF